MKEGKGKRMRDYGERDAAAYANQYAIVPINHYLPTGWIGTCLVCKKTGWNYSITNLRNMMRGHWDCKHNEELSEVRKRTWELLGDPLEPTSTSYGDDDEIPY